MNEYYSGEQLGNYYKKKGKGNLTLFRDKVEWVIPMGAIISNQAP